MKQWEKDVTFSAKPGQQITEDIYDEMLMIMPPLRLPKKAEWEAMTKLNISVKAGFLMGEPVRSGGEWGMLYHAFGIGENGKYYFLGDMPSEHEQPKAERDLEQNVKLFEKLYQGKKNTSLYASELCELYLMAKKASDNGDELFYAIMLTWSAAFVEGVRFAQKQHRNSLKRQK